jgi:hypothetical protein
VRVFKRPAIDLRHGTLLRSGLGQEQATAAQGE